MGVSLVSSQQVFALPWENKLRGWKEGGLGRNGFLLITSLKADQYQYHTGVAENKIPESQVSSDHMKPFSQDTEQPGECPNGLKRGSAAEVLTL